MGEPAQDVKADHSVERRILAGTDAKLVWTFDNLLHSLGSLCWLL